MLGDDLGATLTDAIYGEGSLEKNRHLRRAIRAHFAPYRMYNGPEARLRSAVRALHWAAGGLNKFYLHLPRPWSRRAPGGGCVVALVGIDGSGKSTVSTAVRAWLGSEIDVMPLYFGTGAGPAVAAAASLQNDGAAADAFAEEQARGFIARQGIGGAARVVLQPGAHCLGGGRGAREALQAARRAPRSKSRARVVITDRYPQNEIIGFNDGPLLTRLPRTPSWLRAWEASAYGLAERLPPDLVIKLVASPETIARREPDMDTAVIEKRTGDLPRLTFAGASTIVISAEQPLADVIRAAKLAVWRIL